ncbi:tetratricopeptide repeat-containing sensor histidine kinase [Roseimarinus sediminis]|uniref:tetratricopeptide repeat-containing sensor histidine kinase n=1 Tax=Roseimarinus sediminis TaxID=1610899 RepID=UPI003D20CEB3
MKRISGMLVFLFYSCFLHAASTVDSLLIAAQNSEGDELAAVLISLADQTLYNAAPQSLNYAEQAWQVANETKNDSLKYAALKLMGYANGYLGRYDISLQNMNEGLGYYERTHDSIKIAEALSDIGWLLQALSSDEENIMEYNLRALRIREALGDEKGIAYSLNNIGALYWQWEQFDQAIEYFLQALPYFEKLNATEEQATIYGNIGAWYIETKQEELAKNYLQEALVKYRSIQHKLGEGLILTSLGRLFLQKNQEDSALIYFLQAKEIREKIADREGLVASFYHLGVISLRQNSLETATGYFDRSLQIADSIGLKHKMIDIYQRLSEVALAEADYLKAYHFLKESKELNDSVFSAEKHRQLEEIRAQYDSEKKEAENVQLLFENENQKLILQRNRFIFYLVVAVILLVLLFMYLQFKRRRAEDQLQVVENEQKLLRSQMNPHFIFNAVTAIQNYILSHSAREAINYLGGFAALMRQIIDGSSKELIDLESEKQLIENYLRLQQLRYPGKFTSRIIIDEQLVPDEVKIPPMLSQPFIENAIEHGFKSIDYEGKIEISYLLKGKNLHIAISDNGSGIKENNDQKALHHKGFAIEATKARLKNLSKKMKGSYQLKVSNLNDISPEQHGTLIEFSIPYLHNH